MNINQILEKQKKEKAKAYNAEYYKKNKEKKKKYAHQYYLDNKAEINERNKEWAKNNTAKSKKIFCRKNDVLAILRKQRRNIGDNSYHLLVDELEKVDKHIFKV